MPGSPNDAFYSQAAMFRLSLDSLGEMYHEARLVLCLVSSDGPVPTPARWLPWFNRIEVRWADPSYAFLLNHVQDMYEMVDPGADISVICDADTLFIRPLPAEFLHDMMTAPALCGVAAHYPPPVHNFDDFPPPQNATEMWERMGAALGHKLSLTVPHTLSPTGSMGPLFYINHAFLAGPPALMRQLGVLQAQVRPPIEAVLFNQFADQIAVAMAVETCNLPHRLLPMRYNFPNDKTADRFYPEELDNVIMLHYLRKTEFDRHKIFASKAEFEAFMGMQLQGSDAVFQNAVRKLTRGNYFFGP